MVKCGAKSGVKRGGAPGKKLKFLRSYTLYIHICNGLYSLAYMFRFVRCVLIETGG